MHSGGAQRERRVDLSSKALARLKYKGKITFEIIVDPKLAYKLKLKEITEDEVPILEILEIDAIFIDASKGLRASSEDLIEAFEIDDELEIAKIILKKGELQLTQAQRKELADRKKRQVIAFIAKNAVNPQTNLPHPPTRIEAALQEGKIRIDPYDNLDSQIKRVVKELRAYLPIKLERSKVAVKIPAEYGAQVYGIVKRFGTIKEEQWTDKGYWIVVLELPSGRQADFMEKIQSVSKGRAEIKSLERISLDI